MIDFLADASFPFTVSLILVALIGIMEGISLAFGLSIANALDTILPDFDVDLAHPGHDGAMGHLFSWLSIGRVPFLVLLVIFLAVFGMSGITIQTIADGVFGGGLPVPAAVGLASLAGLLGMSRIGRLVARVLPKDVTDVASRSEILGGIATVIRSEARSGYPAEAKVRDLRGRLHYILLEPEEGEPAVPAGGTAMVVRRDDKTGVYTATNSLKPIA